MILTLIRHAKSSWEYDLNDHERPLLLRGEKDAHLVFSILGNFLPNNYKIFSSSSKRTSETAKIFCNLNDFKHENIILKKGLYTFDGLELEKFIKLCNGDNLIIFGHNPAIAEFVNKFGDFYVENVPTCGVVIIKFEELNTICTKKGVILKTIFPRDLK